MKRILSLGLLIFFATLFVSSENFFAEKESTSYPKWRAQDSIHWYSRGTCRFDASKVYPKKSAMLALPARAISLVSHTLSLETAGVVRSDPSDHRFIVLRL